MMEPLNITILLMEKETLEIKNVGLDFMAGEMDTMLDSHHIIGITREEIAGILQMEIEDDEFTVEMREEGVVVDNSRDKSL